MSPPILAPVDRLVADAKARFADPDQALRWLATVAVDAARGASAGFLRAKPGRPVRDLKPPPPKAL